MQKPLVSIIICCHNRAHLLERTLESVFAQDYGPVEIITVDDGSSDNTPEVIKKYGDRIRYFRQKNQGITAARNTGCRMAEGEYIAFQDDDDIMPPNRITILYDGLCKYPDASFAMGDWACIDNNDNRTGHQSNFKSKLGINDNKPYLIRDGYKAVLSSLISPVPHTTLFRRETGERAGWFDTRFFHSCEDTDFFARCSLHGPIVYVPEIVSLYRQVDNSLCSNKNSILVEYSRILLIEKHFDLIKKNRKDMKKLIQIKLLSALKRIAYLQNCRNIISDTIREDYTAKGVSLLNIKWRLRYMIYKMFRLPVQKFVLSFKCQ